MFGYTNEELHRIGAELTVREIEQQPSTWHSVQMLVEKNKGDISLFLKKIINDSDLEIIFVGAGSSEYVGRTLLHELNKKYSFRISSYGTTDIVVNPEQYLSNTKPTLLVSFARSGNSPESLRTIQLANQICQKVFHLIITCNNDGAIIKSMKDYKNCYSLVLPAETNDRGFAMTSSFSGMYLAALFVFQLGEIEKMKDSLKRVSSTTDYLIKQDWRQVKALVEEFDFERIVYLGSGVLSGIAQEAALKMLELSKGRVASFYNSPLGFRHGSKSLINDKTLTVLFLNDDNYVRKYETDLFVELCGNKNSNDKKLLLSNRCDEDLHSMADYHINFNCCNGSLNTGLLALPYVVTAQILSVLKSIKYGISSDNPYVSSGELSRVVKGVNIYPYPFIKEM